MANLEAGDKLEDSTTVLRVIFLKSDFPDCLSFGLRKKVRVGRPGSGKKTIEYCCGGDG